MSSADSKLLVSSSSFAADVYKPVFRKNAGEKEMMWVGRLVVMLIAVASTLIAVFSVDTIMSLVGNAWAVFGAAFGPTIILSLFWKRFTFPGAIAGIVTGAAVVVLWLTVPVLSGTGLYEIIPGFITGLLAAVITTIIGKKPSAEVEELFEKAITYQD
jgi:sodium/proline symporter